MAEKLYTLAALPLVHYILTLIHSGAMGNQMKTFAAGNKWTVTTALFFVVVVLLGGLHGLGVGWLRRLFRTHRQKIIRKEQV